MVPKIWVYGPPVGCDPISSVQLRKWQLVIIRAVFMPRKVEFYHLHKLLKLSRLASIYVASIYVMQNIATFCNLYCFAYFFFSFCMSLKGPRSYALSTEVLLPITAKLTKLPLASVISSGIDHSLSSVSLQPLALGIFKLKV